MDTHDPLRSPAKSEQSPGPEPGLWNLLCSFLATSQLCPKPGVNSQSNLAVRDLREPTLNIEPHPRGISGHVFEMRCD